MKELIIIMPVYNEAGSIKTVLEKWIAELNRLKIDFSIHAYNDGSKDNSLQILNDIAKTNSYVIVHDKPNSGHGPTILLGYQEQKDAEWIFQIDSDDELIPEDFEKLWQMRNDYDFLIGRRINRNSPYIRRVISFISRWVVWMFYGRRVWDVNCPYRLMRNEVFRNIFLSIPQNTFAPNLIISGMASRNKMRIYQTDISYKPRQTGQVSIRRFRLIKAAIKSFQQTVQYRFHH